MDYKGLIHTGQVLEVWDQFIQAYTWDSFLVTSQWASDITINWPNLVSYLSLTFNQDLWAYGYMRQSIHDTNMSYINTCIIVNDLFLYW